MKKIEAIIKPHLFDAVKDALIELGIRGMTMSEVHGVTADEQRIVFRGATGRQTLVPRIKLEIVVGSERLASAVIRTIEEAGRMTPGGDGKIFVAEVVEAIRIRTGDWGEAAL